MNIDISATMMDIRAYKHYVGSNTNTSLTVRFNMFYFVLQYCSVFLNNNCKQVGSDRDTGSQCGPIQIGQLGNFQNSIMWSDLVLSEHNFCAMSPHQDAIPKTLFDILMNYPAVAQAMPLLPLFLKYAGDNWSQEQEQLVAAAVAVREHAVMNKDDVAS
ncbi:hypothetical protein JB92DRAFT_2824799 [Gautieria morchelliformis]|nr:hypothetical protein JB92DRAFT_2824799 [Gautieria morchelliformis]